MGYKFLREYSTCDLGEERRLFDAQVDIGRLGVMIYELRKAKGLSKKELVQLAGVSKTEVSNVERNISNVKISTVIKMLNTLGGRLS